MQFINLVKVQIIIAFCINKINFTEINLNISSAKLNLNINNLYLTRIFITNVMPNTLLCNLKIYLCDIKIILNILRIGY